MSPLPQNSVKIESPHVTYGLEVIHSSLTYQSTTPTRRPDGTISVSSSSVPMEVETSVRLPKLGLMMVGLGGNNATTLVGTLLANKHGFQWHTKTGIQKADFLGSVSQVGTVSVGLDKDGTELFVPIKDMIPLVNPLDIVVDGWDISSMNLGDAMERAGVFEWELQQQLKPYMETIHPRRGAFFQEFVAANQADRADNVLSGSKLEMVLQLRADIREFKEKKNLDKVVVMWVGNTECFSEIIPGLNDTWANLSVALEQEAKEISPSTLYAIAAIQENCAYINGSPQNTLVPGVLELASTLHVAVCGDDLKTGQTKLKSTLVEYLVGAGLRPESIVSYNHLGNNDGKNLSAPHTFRSKEVTKLGVCDEIVGMNRELFPEGKGPDHLIVIKYIPYVGDSKRAMDEYISSIGMGGKNTLVIHNTCEDSLLAAPIMLDLVIFLELFQRMKVTVGGEVVDLDMGEFLGYWLKAPINSTTTCLSRQRAMVENLIRAAVGLQPNSHLHLHKNGMNAKINGHIGTGIKKVVGHVSGADKVHRSCVVAGETN